MKKSYLIGFIIVLIITISLTTYFIISSSKGLKEKPSESTTVEKNKVNAECILKDNIDENTLDDSYYHFDTNKAILGKDLRSMFSTVIEKFKFLFNKEKYALTSGTVSDISQTDPNSFYYIGKLVKSNTVTKSQNGGSICQEFPSIIYRPSTLGTPPIYKIDALGNWKFTKTGEIFTFNPRVGDTSTTTHPAGPITYMNTKSGDYDIIKLGSVFGLVNSVNGVPTTITWATLSGSTYIPYGDVFSKV